MANPQLSSRYSTASKDAWPGLVQPTRPSSASWRTLVSMPILVGMLGGLVATLFFYWVAVEGSAVPQHPHKVPIAVVGPPAAVAHLAAGLERGASFKVLAGTSDRRAIGLVEERKADAVLDLYSHQLQTAPAASTLTSIVLEQMFSSPTSTLHVSVVAVAPLTPGDPNGMGLMLFLPLASVLGGLPGGLALALLTRPRKPVSLADAGSRLLRTIVYSGLIALCIASLADWILGYGGGQMLTIWGWATLLVCACAACAEAFVVALGTAGFLLAALPLLFFGIPSAPWPAPWNWQSSVFRVLGPYDAVGATADGMRNGIFFGPASDIKDLLVLAVWVLVPVLLMLGLGVLRQGSKQQATRAALASR